MTNRLNTILRITVSDRTNHCCPYCGLLKKWPHMAQKPLQFFRPLCLSNYFLRFARVITSFSCTQFLGKLAPTLYILPPDGNSLGLLRSLAAKIRALTTVWHHTHRFKSFMLINMIQGVDILPNSQASGTLKTLAPFF